MRLIQKLSKLCCVPQAEPDPLPSTRRDPTGTAAVDTYRPTQGATLRGAPVEPLHRPSSKPHIKDPPVFSGREALAKCLPPVPAEGWSPATIPGVRVEELSPSEEATRFELANLLGQVQQSPQGHRILRKKSETVTLTVGEVAYAMCFSPFTKGGTAAVYLGLSPGNQWVAVRSIQDDRLDHVDWPTTLRELEAMQRARSPMLPVQVGQTQSELIEILPLAHGVLSEVFAKYMEMPEVQRALAWYCMEQVLSTLADMHHRTHAPQEIHADIKPDNIFVGSQNELILADFGGSQLLSAEGLATISLFTQHYLSLEAVDAVAGQEPVAGRPVDIWAVGISLLDSLCDPEVVSRRLLDKVFPWQLSTYAAWFSAAYDRRAERLLVDKMPIGNNFTKIFVHLVERFDDDLLAQQIFVDFLHADPEQRLDAPTLVEEANVQLDAPSNAFNAITGRELAHAAIERCKHDLPVGREIEASQDGLMAHRAVLRHRAS
jgi:hypothetical protein